MVTRTTEQFRQRIERDLQRSSDVIFRRTGKRPRVMVWPYGAYSRETHWIADKLGMTISLGLQNVINRVDEQRVIYRYLISGNAKLANFVYGLSHIEEREPIRVAHVDLDYVYDKDKVQREKTWDCYWTESKPCASIRCICRPSRTRMETAMPMPCTSPIAICRFERTSSIASPGN
nr:polysaccharide deacetylase family protein [Methylomarinum sp. Ch1-1]MDP4519212.1 polysaccharide deacetylase family protein [Methylomarinum sp. Ch1-1]